MTRCSDRPWQPHGRGGWDTRRGRIEAALVRLRQDDFGCYVECGEEIAAARLDLDPTVPTCIGCARG